MELHKFLQYLTIRIDIHNENGETTSATGFFARLNNEDVLITAKHVAEKAGTCTLHLRFKEDNESLTNEVICNPNWQTTHDSDLAFCKLNPIKEQLKKVTKKDLYYIALTEDNILPEADKSSDELIQFITIGYVPEGTMIRSGRIIMPMPDTIADDIDLKITGFSGSPIFTKDKQLLGVSLHSETDDMFASIDATAFAENSHLTALKNLL